MQDYEALHRNIVAFIVQQRAKDEIYAKGVMDNFLAIPNFPWPELAKEVTAAWKAYLAQQVK